MQHTYRHEYSIVHLIQLDEHKWWITAVGTVSWMRGRGHAQQVLSMVLADADEEEITLILSIQPDPGTEVERLRKWYRRNGFVDIADDVQRRAMSRVPRPVG